MHGYKHHKLLKMLRSYTLLEIKQIRYVIISLNDVVLSDNINYMNLDNIK